MSTEEEKYLFAELNARIHATEYNVDCIHKEIDILNADLDELPLRIVIFGCSVCGRCGSSSVVVYRQQHCEYDRGSMRPG